jgi:phosphoglycolate phosphatase-like HAD superfamily hydrolase
MDVCLFDIDGTLISTGGAGKAALAAALASEFGVSQISDRLELSGRTDRAILKDLFLLHDVTPSPASEERLLQAYLGHLPACLASTTGQVLPGIAAFLEHLRTRNQTALGLLTGNVRDGARLKLGHYGLWHHFGFGGFGDHHADRDDVARAALAEVHRHYDGAVAPERIWVIGDTPADIRCARAIGVRVAAVATGWHSLEELLAHDPDVALADLSEPAPLLALWDA